MASTGLPPQSHEDSLTWLSSHTKDPVFNREHGRMHRQHLLVRAAMQNRLIYAPIINSPARSRELDILDSACNDGTWILDVIAHRTAQLRVQEDTKMNFVGTDLDKKHFSGRDLKSTLPPNMSVTFQVQDIRQPWPENLRDRFDLVRQRFALQYLGDSDESAQQAMSRMVALAKPGTSWIQLVEANVVGWAEGGRVSAPALQRARQMALDFCAKLSIDSYSHRSLGRWLKESGAVDVEVRDFEWPVGGETELGRKGLRNVLEFLGTQRVVTAEWRDFGYTGEEYDRVIRELEGYFGAGQVETAWAFAVA